MGMTETQRLWTVEAPLALPVILEGVRLSAVIALATAAIGSTVAAKGLGEVIIAGLLSNNLAFVVQGGVIIAMLAITLYEALSIVERIFARRAGRVARRQEA
jgi:osmoprotectant transport system permease protein